MRRAAGFAIVSGLVLSVALSAEAKTTRDLTYRSDQIWNSAIRFLRVDLKYPILEKDKEAAYLLFEYKEAGHSYAATLELVPASAGSRPIIKATLNIGLMPSYVEEVLLNSFLRKLKSDYGEQPAIAPPQTSPKTDGAGKDKGKGDDSGKAKAALKASEDDEKIVVTGDNPEDSVAQEPAQ
ncbi:MAG: hypothetical protein PHU25_07305 [Deltaproteobacteria bacterium]|nr:hypothetical protein [Deltaproteobacteria bacterium]